MANLNSLTKRELEVFKLLLQGKSNKQIAAALYISEHTVVFHLGNIYRKLGVSSNVEAIALGKSLGDQEVEKLGESAVEAGGGQVHNVEEAELPEKHEGMAARAKSQLHSFGELVRRYTWLVLVCFFIGSIFGLILGVILSIAVFQAVIYRRTVWQGYAREGEHADYVTVGQTLSRQQASGAEVHGQFGCEGESPWTAKAGEVRYDNIRTPALDNFYLNLHYSKNSSSTTDILVYLDKEPVPRATIRPVDQQDWNRFVWTGLISLGDVTEGVHSIRFYTDGQQYGVADLDQFYLTARPP